MSEVEVTSNLIVGEHNQKATRDTDGKEGIRVLYEPASSVPERDIIDIVAIHGIGAHPYRTWTFTNNQNPEGQTDINWLKDPCMLPKAFPNARIMRFGYHSNWYGARARNFSITDVARNLLTTLHTWRTRCLNRRIIFIAHCYGGLVLIKSLSPASRPEQKCPGLVTSTAGIIFFGTPFRGTANDLRPSQMLAAAMERYGKDAVQPMVLQALDSENQFLPDMVDEFTTIGPDLRAQIICFTESIATQVGAIFGDPSGGRTFAVEKEAGCLDCSWTTHKYSRAMDHFEVNKFDSEEDNDFRIVCHHMRSMLQDERFIAAGESKETAPPHRLRVDTSTQALETCLRSLGFPDIDFRRNTISDAHKDTCDWIFDTQEFDQWYDGDDAGNSNGILWIKGKPGAGKSTMMKHIFEDLLDNEEDTVIVAHFFNARGVSLEKTDLGMLRSLTYQLVDCDPAFQNFFLATYQDKSRKSGNSLQWSAQELENSLVKFFKRIEASTIQRQSYFILVDALDECKESEVQKMAQIFHKLSSAASARGLSLKICLSSRHYPRITVRNAKEFDLDKETLHIKDIERYVRDELETNDDDLIETICRKANGVFMWVVLVVVMLNKDIRSGIVKNYSKRLNAMPSDLEDLFDRILHEDDPNTVDDIDRLNGKNATILLLQWVLLSKPILCAGELYYAVMSGLHETVEPRSPSLETGEVIKTWILSTSRGLVEVLGLGDDDERHWRVQFIHGTVTDFLFRGSRLSKLLGCENGIGCSYDRLADCCWTTILRAQREARMKPSCLLRLATEEPANARRWTFQLRGRTAPIWIKAIWNEAPVATFPFLSHALQHKWAYANEAQKHSVPQLLRIRQLLSSDAYNYGRSDADHHAVDDRAVYRKLPSFSWILVCDESFEILKIWLQLAESNVILKSDINHSTRRHGTALYEAAATGKLNFVKLLIEAGASINKKSGHLGNALQAAATNIPTCTPKCAEVVQFLLDKGANANALGGVYGTALIAAAKHGSLEAMQILLDAGADPFDVGRHGGNALHAAAGTFDSAAKKVDILLDLKMDVNDFGGMHKTALQAAVSGVNLNVVCRLLEEGANPHIVGGSEGSAWLAACTQYERDSPSIRSRLLQAGVDVNWYCDGHGTGLGAALRSIWDELLDRDGCNEFPLNTIRWLLEHKADPNIPTGYGSNALQTSRFFKVKFFGSGWACKSEDESEDFEEGYKYAIDKLDEEIIELLDQYGAVDDSLEEPVYDGICREEDLCIERLWPDVQALA